MLSALCWIVSVITGDLSQVDRLWSILPPAYTVYFWSCAPDDGRLTVMVLLTLAWGGRLTYNFWRKGFSLAPNPFITPFDSITAMSP